MQLISATPKVAFNRRHPCGKNTRRQMTSRSISCINSRLRLIDLLFCRNAAKVIQENDSLKCNTSFCLLLYVRLYIKKHIRNPLLHSPSLTSWHATDVISTQCPETNHTHIYLQYKQQFVTQHTSRERPNRWKKFKQLGGSFAYCCCELCSLWVGESHRRNSFYVREHVRKSDVMGIGSFGRNKEMMLLRCR